MIANGQRATPGMIHWRLILQNVDFDEVLTEAGFSSVSTEKVGATLFTAAAK